MSAFRMKRDLVFGKGLYQLVHVTLPTNPSAQVRPSILHPCHRAPVRADDRRPVRGHRRDSGKISPPEGGLHGGGRRLGPLLDGAVG